MDGHIFVKNECDYTVFVSAAVDDGTGGRQIVFLVRTDMHEGALEVPPRKVYTLEVDDDVRPCQTPEGDWRVKFKSILPLTTESFRKPDEHDGPIICIKPAPPAVLH